MNTKVRLTYLIAVISNSINCAILILADKRGGDVTVQLKYSGWMILVWIMSFLLVVLIPNPINDSEGKNHFLLRTIAIIFCTPIPFMVGCVAFH